jgi:hypothetical protein
MTNAPENETFPQSRIYLLYSVAASTSRTTFMLISHAVGAEVIYFVDDI